MVATFNNAGEVVLTEYRGGAFHQTRRVWLDWMGDDFQRYWVQRVNYDHDREIMQEMMDMNETVFTVHGGSEEPIYQEFKRTRTEEPKRAYPLTDHLGSTIAYTDPAGALTQRNFFTAFGQNEFTDDLRTTTDHPKGFQSPLYTGRRYIDSSNRLLDFRFRTYDQSMGIFISRDALGYRYNHMGNLYDYSSSDPINYIDPYGLWRINRKSSSSWARACAEKGDSIKTLQEQIALKETEAFGANGWLKREDGTPAISRSEIKPGKAFLVPNKIIVYLPALVSWTEYVATSFVSHLQETARKEADLFEDRGFNVVRIYNAADPQTFSLSWQSNGITGFIYAGHGSKEGGLAVAYNPNVDDEFEFVNPSEITLKYKLSRIHVYACYSSQKFMGNELLTKPDGTPYFEMVNWKNHWSNINGSFRSYSGVVNWFNYSFYEEHYGSIP